MVKKNIRKIPAKVTRRLEHIEGDNIVAAYLGSYSAEELRAGRFNHLGITLNEDGLVCPSSVLPPQESGKYSDRNINGHEIRRDDLPKERHYNSVDSPNWGDSAYGYHTVYLPYDRYPRDFIAPRGSSIRISCPNPQAGSDVYSIGFEVDWVLGRTDPEFETHLLEALNLLQENVGACGVEKAGTSVAEYENSLTVSWEILPPGTKEEAVTRIFRGRTPTEKERTSVEERYDFLKKLNPEKFVYGSSGFQRYFGALLQDDLVVFENVEYGNAVYVMFEGWADLSQRSRTELLSGRYGNNFERVLHTKGWKGRVKKIVEDHQSELLSS